MQNVACLSEERWLRGRSSTIFGIATLTSDKIPVSTFRSPELLAGVLHLYLVSPQNVFR